MPKKGRPEGTNIPVEIRFWKFVNKTPGQGPNGDCWIWTGARAGRGYGIIGLHVAFGRPLKPQYAHRLSYKLAYGEFADSLFVLHKCDTPACVNPAHLFLGTQRENMNDMLRKGRSSRGEKNASSKINFDIAEQIRQRRREGLTLLAIGKEFDLSFQHISDIIHGKYWQKP